MEPSRPRCPRCILRIVSKELNDEQEWQLRFFLFSLLQIRSAVCNRKPTRISHTHEFNKHTPDPICRRRRLLGY